MNKILITKNGQTLQIDENSFASGGEGDIYNLLSHPSFVAKLTFQNTQSDLYEKKIEYMVNHPPFNSKHSQATKESLIWPVQAVYDEKKKFLGFYMQKLKESVELKNLTVLNSTLLNQADWWKYNLRMPEAFQNRVKICYNLAQALNILHSTGNYVMVDLKPENIMIRNNGFFSLIDLDSIQIGTKSNILFHAQAITEDYAAPEISRLNYKTDFISPSWDYFCFAIIVYELLIGIHPFQAVAKLHEPDLAKNIQNGFFVHGENRKFLKVVPNHHNSFSDLPYNIKQTFLKTFGAGCFNESFRANFEEWIAILKPIAKPVQIASNGEIKKKFSISYEMNKVTVRVNALINKLKNKPSDTKL